MVTEGSLTKAVLLEKESEKLFGIGNQVKGAEMTERFSRKREASGPVANFSRVTPVNWFGRNYPTLVRGLILIR